MQRSTRAQQESERALSQQVRSQFLSAYLNGLKTTLDTLEIWTNQRQDRGFQQIQLKYKIDSLRNEAATLVRRMRPLAENYLVDIPLSATDLTGRLKLARQYLEKQESIQELGIEDAERGTYWCAKVRSVTNELDGLGSCIRDQDTAQQFMDGISALKKSRVFLAGTVSLDDEQVEVMQSALRVFQQMVDRIDAIADVERFGASVSELNDEPA